METRWEDVIKEKKARLEIETRQAKSKQVTIPDVPEIMTREDLLKTFLKMLGYKPYSASVKMGMQKSEITQWILRKGVTDKKLKSVAEALGCEVKVHITFYDGETGNKLIETDIEESK